MATRMAEGSDSRSRQLDQYTLIAKEIVRPSSPTPSYLKTYNLSLFDQFNPSVYIPVVFFYPNDSVTSREAKAAQLKKSLSETLTQYYPFSGRLVAATNGAAYVDCNDEGVDFLEVQSDTSLSKLVEMYNLEYQPFDQLFPNGTGWDRPSTGWGSLVMVQLTYFSCGGIALAVSLCHKIGDGSTFFTFLNHWAAVNQQHLSVVNDKVQPLPPHLVSSSEADFSSFHEFVLNKGNHCVTKKFVFPNSKLAELKDKVKGIINPTRIEVLTSLLYECAVRAAMANSHGNSFKGYILALSVNVRKRMVNPLPDTHVGNIVKGITLPTMKESELSFDSLTARIKNAKLQLWGVTNAQIDECVITSAAASRNVTSEYDFGLYATTSFCNFPAYEVDFGWGKPVRMSIAESATKNLFHLLDTPNRDGIEALVRLEKEDMDIFQKDKQLLAFAL